MSDRDLYEVLGVNRHATPEEIKKAFRKQAMTHHPDRNPNNPDAEERFKEVQQAYQILSDPHERAYYDRTGRTGGQRASASDSPFGSGFGFDPNELFSDLFGQFFGRQRTVERGSDVRFNLTIGFMEAAFGGESKIKVSLREKCATCQGSGARPGSGPETCGFCGGTGEMMFRQGFIAIRRACRHCNGAGKVIREKCVKCGGVGTVAGVRALSVRIPAGVKEGAKLKLAGEGNPGQHGAPAGDLYVILNIEPHPRFSRKDDDIVAEVSISFPRAALGAEITIPTLEGDETLRIPPGTQSGKVFTLRGKGIPHLHGAGRGDEHIVVNVETPTRLSDAQKDLLRELANLDGESIEPKRRGLFDKVKDFIG